MKTTIRRLWALGAAAFAVLGPGSASAQRYEFSAIAGVSTGVEGNGQVSGVRRARTTLRVGAEARLDEAPESAFDVSLLAEIEPHASAGIDVRYVHFASKRLAFFAGGTFLAVPKTFLGAGGGLEYRVPMGKSARIAVGPSAHAFFFGDDLPRGTVVWQGLFNLSAHVDLLK